MLLTVTVFLHKSKQNIDIQTSSQQKIIDVLEILQENNIIEKNIMEEKIAIRSKRKGEYINTLLSFEQANILNADIIEVE